MKRNFYQATRKARRIFYSELNSSNMYRLGMLLFISGSTLMMVKVHEFLGTLEFLLGLAMYLTARRKTAKKEIY